MEQVKAHYPCEELKHVSVKPEMPQKKSVEELFALAKEKLEQGVQEVILILDLDTIRKEASEKTRFKDFYTRYTKVQQNDSPKRTDVWMKNLVLVVNNPCLEYWYILHFRNTTKFYDTYADLKRDLVRIPNLKDYDKTDEYYHKQPNMYKRLEQELPDGRRNATPFSIEAMDTAGCSEMNTIFDFLDRL